jgi:hypothetical protein
MSNYDDGRETVLFSEYERLRDTRDELVAALEDLLHELDTDDVGGLVEGQMERSRKVIAKAKEQP